MYNHTMSKKRALAAIVLVPFTIYSCWVTYTQGYRPFFTLPWSHPIWTQEFLDLCIALTMVTTWMVGDARSRGATVWPYLVATPLLGSISPLVYLVLRPPLSADRGAAAAAG
jgi:hypothetical protein